MNFTDHRSKLTVTGQLIREEGECLHLSYSMEGAIEAELAFYAGLNESLKKPKTISKHMKFAQSKAAEVAKQYGCLLVDYNFFGIESHQERNRIREHMTRKVTGL